MECYFPFNTKIVAKIGISKTAIGQDYTLSDLNGLKT
jgi:hypothetical protein